jgi:hypothetical protein
MSDDAPTYTIPEADTERRGEHLTRIRADRAYWLHRVLALVPGEQQPEALAHALETERVETGGLLTLSDLWRETVQKAYTQGRADGGKAMAETLGVIDPPKPDEPLTMH